MLSLPPVQACHECICKHPDKHASFIVHAGLISIGGTSHEKSCHLNYLPCLMIPCLDAPITNIRAYIEAPHTVHTYDDEGGRRRTGLRIVVFYFRRASVI